MARHPRRTHTILVPIFYKAEQPHTEAGPPRPFLQTHCLLHCAKLWPVSQVKAHPQPVAEGTQRGAHQKRNSFKVCIDSFE